MFSVALTSAKINTFIGGETPLNPLIIQDFMLFRKPFHRRENTMETNNVSINKFIREPLKTRNF